MWCVWVQGPLHRTMLLTECKCCFLLHIYTGKHRNTSNIWIISVFSIKTNKGSKRKLVVFLHASVIQTTMLFMHSIPYLQDVLTSTFAILCCSVIYFKVEEIRAEKPIEIARAARSKTVSQIISLPFFVPCVIVTFQLSLEWFGNTGNHSIFCFHRLFPKQSK